MKNKANKTAAKKKTEPDIAAEMTGMNFIMNFSLSMDLLSNKIEEIQNICNGSFSLIGDSIYGEWDKPPMFVPKDLFIDAFETLVDEFSSIDPDELYAALNHTENARECLIKNIEQLRQVFFDIIHPFKTEVSDIALYKTAESRLFAFLTEFENLFLSTTPIDMTTAQASATSLMNSIEQIANDVYRSEPTPSEDGIAISDEPMSFPSPDLDEMMGSLPSKDEAINIKIDWKLNTQQCDCLFMSLDTADKPLFINDCIARLWGYSMRIWNSTSMSLRQKAQLPRFAMYPFYFRFFDFAYGILNAVNHLKNKEETVRPASVVMDNPIQGLPLAQRMKDVLLYAPREYFNPGLKHHAYLLIVKNVYESVMAALQSSIPISVRLHASTHFKTAQKSFNEFLFTLQNPTTDSIRIFIAKCDRIIQDFKSALEELAAILKCIEGDIQHDAPQPQTVQLNTEISEKLNTLIGASKNAAKSDKEIKELINETLYHSSGHEAGSLRPDGRKMGELRKQMVEEAVKLIKDSPHGETTPFAAARSIIKAYEKKKLSGTYTNSEVDAFRKAIERECKNLGLRT